MEATHQSKLNFSFAENEEVPVVNLNDSFGANEDKEEPNTEYYHTSVVQQQLLQQKPTVVTNYQAKRELEVMQKYGIKKIVPSVNSSKTSNMR